MDDAGGAEECEGVYEDLLCAATFSHLATAFAFAFRRKAGLLVSSVMNDTEAPAAHHLHRSSSLAATSNDYTPIPLHDFSALSASTSFVSASILSFCAANALPCASNSALMSDKYDFNPSAGPPEPDAARVAGAWLVVSAGAGAATILAGEGVSTDFAAGSGGLEDDVAGIDRDPFGVSEGFGTDAIAAAAETPDGRSAGFSGSSNAEGSSSDESSSSLVSAKRDAMLAMESLLSFMLCGAPRGVAETGDGVGSATAAGAGVLVAALGAAAGWAGSGCVCVGAGVLGDVFAAATSWGASPSKMFSRLILGGRRPSAPPNQSELDMAGFVPVQGG